MSGIPDRRWDDIQRGRDPDSLAWERARDEDLRRAQRRDLGTSLERLELKCRNLLDGK
jgi:hypothetical protein